MLKSVNKNLNQQQIRDFVNEVISEEIAIKKLKTFKMFDKITIL